MSLGIVVQLPREFESLPSIFGLAVDAWVRRASFSPATAVLSEPGEIDMTFVRENTEVSNAQHTGANSSAGPSAEMADEETVMIAGLGRPRVEHVLGHLAQQPPKRTY